MKRTLTLTMLAIASTGYPQGMVNFSNRGSGVDAPISFAAGTAYGGAGGTIISGTLSPTAQAALYAGPSSATEAQLVLAGPPADFLSGGLAGYLFPGTRTIPTLPPGTLAKLQVRAWDANNGTVASSFEQAAAIPGAYLGKSVLFVVQLTGSTAPPANLIGLTAFSIAPLSVNATPPSDAYAFSTLAGYSGLGSADGLGIAAKFNVPLGVAVETNGTLFVADSENKTIRKITAGGVVSTIAGMAGSDGSADGTNGAARFARPAGIALDTTGNLFVADADNNTIRKITPLGPNWVVTTIAGLAGTGNGGSADGTNRAAQFSGPLDVALDRAGNIYVADGGNNSVRKISTSGTNWIVSTLAGIPGTNGFTDGTNRIAQFSGPSGIAVDTATNVYVADQDNHTIRKLTPVGTNWVVTTIAGRAIISGFVNSTNTLSRFNQPTHVAVDTNGILYVTDSGNQLVRKITPMGTNWIASTLAGRVGVAGSTDGTGTNALFNLPYGVEVDRSGTVYLSDSANTIRKISSAGVVRTVAGSSGVGTADGNGSAARFNQPLGAAVDRFGVVHVADTANHTIREISAEGQVGTLAGLAGVSGTDNGVGDEARFNGPTGIGVDRNGDVYVSDYFNHTIRKVTAAGVVTNLAGRTGVPGSMDGSNQFAFFRFPAGLAVDLPGLNVYVADSLNYTIRRLTFRTVAWEVKTIAGAAGTNGFADGTNNTARFGSLSNGPNAVAVDGAGNVFVADTGNGTIRRIAPMGPNFVVTTIAGKARNLGHVDGVGPNARFYAPQGITMASPGTLYVADSVSNTIRRVALSGTNWIVTTLGGGGSPGSADGAGQAARFDRPAGLTVDGAGNIFVADSANNTIRKGVFIQYAPTNPATYIPPPMTGRLSVTLQPPQANGQWRFPWELAWRNSGTTASNLAEGNYPVEFKNVPGWLAIPPRLIDSNAVAVSSGALTRLTNQYYPTLLTPGAMDASGSLTVNIAPNKPAGSGWRFLGDATEFFAPGSGTNLFPGTHLIEFASVPGFAKPPNLSVEVQAGFPTIISVNYLLAASPPANVQLPAAIPTNQINDLANFPFGFNGQLQSDTGFGSGVAVQPNVVLTAAHIVFNDQTLAYVSRAYWYLRREVGVFDPQPLLARGWYILGGYAVQRTNDLGHGFVPDQSSAQSRNLDVAAIYFFSAVAGGGHGGYLPSDDEANPWLTGANLKMLVGYPVDGSFFGNTNIVPGLMYQTLPQSDPLTLATDPVNGSQKVYTAPWFLSYPGNSGGPLYAQLNGYYYPAGVYLGTLFNGSAYLSVVRAIDSAVTNMITLAATSGDGGGTNNTGGGVITIIPNQGISANNPGYLQFHLAPPSVVRAGAAWRLQGDSGFGADTNYVRQINSTNSFAVEFKEIAGWNSPSNQNVFVLPNARTPTVYTAFYSVTNPLFVNRPVGFGFTGTTGTTYRVEQRSSLASGNWSPLSTNTINSTGFNLVLPKPLTNPPTTFYRLHWLPDF